MVVRVISWSGMSSPQGKRKGRSENIIGLDAWELPLSGNVGLWEFRQYRPCFVILPGKRRQIKGNVFGWKRCGNRVYGSTKLFGFLRYVGFVGNHAVVMRDAQCIQK